MSEYLNDNAPTVPELLRSGADTYEERARMYGNDYKEWGKLMMALFPNGIHLNDEGDFNRFNILTRVLGKMTRYAAMLNRGGHVDSAHDACVYSAMLQELTDELPF